MAKVKRSDRFVPFKGKKVSDTDFGVQNETLSKKFTKSGSFGILTILPHHGGNSSAKRAIKKHKGYPNSSKYGIINPKSDRFIEMPTVTSYGTAVMIAETAEFVKRIDKEDVLPLRELSTVRREIKTNAIKVKTATLSSGSGYVTGISNGNVYAQLSTDDDDDSLPSLNGEYILPINRYIFSDDVKLLKVGAIVIWNYILRESAGKTINFEIRVKEMNDLSNEELKEADEEAEWLFGE